MAAMAICLYRQRPGALLDRAGAEGNYLGARGIME